ncbi:MAG: M56 family metallopeptidase [Firmicutes bacterium]|nr:M56 family metallopeptidase [Bacillota bacterium]
MNYSFSTMLMTVLASNLLIVMIVLCFRSRKILLSVGYKLIAVFLALTVLRFLFPFEVPFSRNIYFPGWLSKGVAYFRHPFLRFGMIRISACTILGCVWIGGTVYFIYKHFKDKASCRHYIIRYGENLTKREPYKRMMAEICGSRRNPLWVVKVPYYGAPMQYGTIRPYIVLPSTMNFSEEEIYYILRHETAHYYRHDALLKDAIGILRAIYWWNPLAGQMEKKTDLLLEMRVDEKLIAGDAVAREAYCRTLDRVNEEIRGKSAMPGIDAAIPVADVKSEDLERRQSMMRRNKEKRGPLFYGLAAFAVGIYIASYCFTLEAYAFRPWDVAVSNSVADDCMYAVLREDGTYDVYLNGHFAENVDTLECYIGISVREELE